MIRGAPWARRAGQAREGATRQVSRIFRPPGRPRNNSEAALTEDGRREEKRVLDGEAFMMKTGASEGRTTTPTNRTGQDRTNERQSRGKAEARRKQSEHVGGEISRYTQSTTSATRRVQGAEPVTGDTAERRRPACSSCSLGRTGVAPPGLQPRRANGQAIEQNGLAKRGSEREWAESPFLDRRRRPRLQGSVLLEGECNRGFQAPLEPCSTAHPPRAGTPSKPLASVNSPATYFVVVSTS
jgi:hypothetical protein